MMVKQFSRGGGKHFSRKLRFIRDDFKLFLGGGGGEIEIFSLGEGREYLRLLQGS